MLARYSLQVLQLLLPPSLARWSVDVVADSATALVTNNRGPADWISFDGRRCTYWVSWAPQRGTIGLTMTVFTYAGLVRSDHRTHRSALHPTRRDWSSLPCDFAERHAELARLTSRPPSFGRCAAA